MIRAAIVGLGWWGQMLVNAAQGKGDELTFVTAHSRTRQKVEGFCRDRKLAWADNLDAILADPSIDAVVFATPHSQHAEQVRAAAAAGKHVFVEKPFTLTAADARMAAEAAKTAGIVLAVGFNRRFHPSIAALRAQVRENRLGVISNVMAEQTALGGLMLTRDSWRADPHETPAAAMTGIGVHLVDGMIDLVGRVSEVYCATARRATTEVDDVTNIVLRFENGVTATIYCSIASTPVYRFAVHGTKGFAEVTGNGYETFSISVPQPGNLLNVTSTMTPGFNTLTAELLAFARAIETKQPFPVPVDEVIHGIEVLEAVAKSVETGLPVTLLR